MAAIRGVARASLYRAPINLWVEDETTRTYLAEAWADPAVAFFIGGGNEGVTAVVNDAEKAGYSNVFAVIDRDFRETNKSGWLDARKTFRRFILPVHEIENYLLDARALSASRFNNLKRTVAEIEELMHEKAARLCWWAACRDVVAELRKRFREDFVSDPTAEIDSKAEALAHVRDSRWFQRLADHARRTTEKDIQRLLSSARRRAGRSLRDGTWTAEFAGKELLHDIASRICHRPGMPGYRPTPAEFDEDIAKDIGAWQRQNKAVPPDLTDLLNALHTRIARRGASP
ncbi:MAG: hypothetical protein ACLQIB_28010 [Isosphaeraceae bacterium]